MPSMGCTRLARRKISAPRRISDSFTLVAMRVLPTREGWLRDENTTLGGGTQQRSPSGPGRDLDVCRCEHYIVETRRDLYCQVRHPIFPTVQVISANVELRMTTSIPHPVLGGNEGCRSVVVGHMDPIPKWHPSSS